MIEDDSLYVIGTRNFGIRLKSQRENIGLTQVALARQVGVSTTTIQNYEAGNIPKGSHLVQLSRVLKCSIDYLLVGEESPYIQESWISENPSGMNQEKLVEYHQSIKGTWLEPIVFRGRNEYSGGSSSGRSAKVVGIDQPDQFRQFRDKQRAQDANLDLLALERLNRAAFIEACAYIKGMLGGLQAAEKGLTYTGPERRVEQRRKVDDPEKLPEDGDRRSGLERRKVVNS